MCEDIGWGRQFLTAAVMTLAAMNPIAYPLSVDPACNRTFNGPGASMLYLAASACRGSFQPGRGK